MKNTKALCQTAVVAALYVALTTLNPLSWGVIQFRVANMLCALPFKDKRYAPAVLLGIAIANATSPFGPVDVLFGRLRGLHTHWWSGGRGKGWGFCGKQSSSPCPWLCSSAWNCL